MAKERRSRASSYGRMAGIGIAEQSSMRCCWTIAALVGQLKCILGYGIAAQGLEERHAQKAGVEGAILSHIGPDTGPHDAPDLDAVEFDDRSAAGAVGRRDG